MNESEKYKFKFSLAVLNQLNGRLYTSLPTAIAEAVSNSWDANATEVNITINAKKNNMIIQDNGFGMDEYDFRDKFLLIGYSKRNEINRIAKNRRMLGRNGVGKLALSTISDEVIIISKKNKYKKIGAKVDSHKLREAMRIGSQFELETFDDTKLFTGNKTGTHLEFKKIDSQFSNEDLVRKNLALLFNFSFSFGREKFNIKVNDDIVSKDDLIELNQNTKYAWLINLDDENIEKINNRFKNSEQCYIINDKNKISFTYMLRQFTIRGFIAAVANPDQIKIKTPKDKNEKDENIIKAGVHLFANGRSRHEDIFRDIKSAKTAASHLWGEIHVDEFDNGEEDILSASRDDLLLHSSDEYKIFLKKMKIIVEEIIYQWGKSRSEIRIKSFNNKLIDILHNNIDSIQDDKRNAITEIAGFINENKSDKYIESLKILHPVLNDIEAAGDMVFKKIMIVHSSKDKAEADIMYKILLAFDFTPKEILYSSSGDLESEIPLDTNIFDYIKKFFIPDLMKKPVILFLYSSNLIDSWYASLEVGATWVTGIKHYVFTKEGESPQAPLNQNHNLYGQINDIKNRTAWKIFNGLCEKFNKDRKSLKEYEDIISNILDEN